MNHEDLFWLRLSREGKEQSKAGESWMYRGDFTNRIKFDRERRGYMDRIKELLREWAGYYQDGLGAGYPKQSAFATERVQNSNRSTDTYRAIPEAIVRLNDCIEKGLAPNFKNVVRLEYRDKRPQKTKAALLGIPREVFSVRLRYAMEQLDHMMYGG